jgi:hypothetical protein
MTESQDLFNRIMDREWRLRNLYKIVDKNGHRVLFNENPIQKKIRLSPAKRKRILKARQFGVSTGCIIDHFDATIWTPDTTTLLCCGYTKKHVMHMQLMRLLHPCFPAESCLCMWRSQKERWRIKVLLNTSSFYRQKDTSRRMPKCGLIYSNFSIGYKEVGTSNGATESMMGLGVAPGIMVQYKVSETLSTNLDLSYIIYQESFVP